jgi:hypothetical protein
LCVCVVRVYVLCISHLQAHTYILCKADALHFIDTRVLFVQM